MYFGYDRNTVSKYHHQLLDKHFTLPKVQEGELKAQDIEDYVQSIKASAPHWYAIHFPGHVDKDRLALKPRLWLARLDRLGRGASAPLLMASLTGDLPQTEAGEIMKMVESFNFLINAVCQRKSNTGDSVIYNLAHDLYRGEKTKDDILNRLQELTHKYLSMSWAISSMQEEWEGFYSWRGRHYFLYEYEEHLREAAGMNQQKVDWESFSKAKKDYFTIEHILPQSANLDEWPEFSQLSEEERYSYLHSLGNLLPLSTHRNAAFSNRSFKSKREGTGNYSGYTEGSLSEIKVAEKETWSPQQIRERSFQMFEFLEKRWGLNSRWKVKMSKNEKEKFLLLPCSEE